MVIIQAAEVVENVQFGPAQLALFRVHNRVLEVSKKGSSLRNELATHMKKKLEAL
jgi:hypothetical protein